MAQDPKKTLIAVKNAVVEYVDVNGDGEIDIEDIITTSMRVPGVKINRASFLRQEFFKNYPKEMVEEAIKSTPAIAGIPAEDIDKMADEVIKFERYGVSGISAALGAPGGLVMVAAIPADIVQYYGHILRTAQKLLYLYGFPEINVNEKGQKLDSETMNILIVSLGVMNGVAGANNALKAMAHALAQGIEKKLLKAALTKGTIYPIVKGVASWFGKKMTKEIFAGFFKKAIPVVGGVLGGGVTFAMFKPCCVKLKLSLQDTLLSNPNHVTSVEEENIIARIEAGEPIEE